MIEIDLKPDSKKLRQFGWICLGGFGLLGLIVAYRTGAFHEPGHWTIPAVLWTLAAVCPLLGLLVPIALKPVYLLLTLVSYPIGLVVSNVVLLLFFGLLITPIAIWFRLIGRDELNRKWPSQARSYWLEYPESRGPESYYRQF